MSKERILVVEDEPAMRRGLVDCLGRQGYRVLVASSGDQGLEMALEEAPDLILLDIMLPGLDGLAICRELRRLERRVPILMLTARASVEDRVAGLDLGADDYLTKPFSRSELLARVRALLRRLESRESEPSRVWFGAACLDFRAMQAQCSGQAVLLSRKEWGVLRLLVQREGAVVSRQEFLDLVWGYNAFPTTRTVDRHVVGLRQKFESDPSAPEHLLTVHGAGYQLVGVRHAAPASSGNVTNSEQSEPSD